MEKKEVRELIDRLDNVLRCVRNQNSGADIHRVGNIRNSASGMKFILEDDPSCIDEKNLRKMVKNVENDVVEFFRVKYGVEPLQKLKS